MLYEITVLERLARRSVDAPCPVTGLELPCWIWTGHTNPGGYGSISVNHPKGWRPVLTHRTAYTILIGSIPDGLELDHLCRVRACWNPWHLDPVTRHVNIMRGLIPKRGDTPGTAGAHQRARTHCPQGHPYDEANTRVSRDGRRSCRSCSRIRAMNRRTAGRNGPKR